MNEVEKGGGAVRISEVRGKPILSADSGEKVGRVDDLLLDGTRHRIVAVLVIDGTLSKQRILPYDEVQAMGVDALIVKTAATMLDAKEWVHDGRPANRSRALYGKDVVTAEGARIGTLRDLLANDRTGQVVALEIATGRHGVRLSRPALVHEVGTIALANDVIVVPTVVSAPAAER